MTAAAILPYAVEGSYDPDLWLYRERTTLLLKKYLRMAVEVGRLPSLLGREVFRSKVTSYRTVNFEDAVIFVYDMERALERLEEVDQEVIALVVFQDHTVEEAASRIRCRRRTLARYLPDALDHLSELMLQNGMLTALPGTRRSIFPKSCQEGKNYKFLVSGCNNSE